MLRHDQDGRTGRMTTPTVGGLKRPRRRWAVTAEPARSPSPIAVDRLPRP
jgi:hypothetical protein